MFYKTSSFHKPYLTKHSIFLRKPVCSLTRVSLRNLIYKCQDQLDPHMAYMARLIMPANPGGVTHQFTHYCTLYKSWKHQFNTRKSY